MWRVVEELAADGFRKVTFRQVGRHQPPTESIGNTPENARPTTTGALQALITELQLTRQDRRAHIVVVAAGAPPSSHDDVSVDLSQMGHLDSDSTVPLPPRIWGECARSPRWTQLSSREALGGHDG